tara:strand:- start:204 stop:575 length:372 start_codon:yes stop_codon:yes gene_type:complete
MINKELKYKFHFVKGCEHKPRECPITSCEDLDKGLYKFEDRLTEDNKTHDDVVKLLKELKQNDIKCGFWTSTRWYVGNSWNDAMEGKDEVAESFLLHFFNHEGHKHKFMVSSCGSVVIELVSD